MKKIFLTLLLSFAIISCENNQSDVSSDYPTIIDESELVELTNKQYEAMNSGDIESVVDMYADDAMWSFPNGVNMEGKDAIRDMLESTTSIWNITSGDDQITWQ